MGKIIFRFTSLVFAYPTLDANRANPLYKGFQSVRRFPHSSTALHSLPGRLEWYREQGWNEVVQNPCEQSSLGAACLWFSHTLTHCTCAQEQQCSPADLLTATLNGHTSMPPPAPSPHPLEHQCTSPCAAQSCPHPTLFPSSQHGNSKPKLSRTYQAAGRMCCAI